MEIKLTRRGMLFKIARLLTNRLIKGEFAVANVAQISTENLFEKVNSAQPPLMIDTRSAEEYSSGFGHIPNARHIPLMEMVGGFGSTEKFKNKVKQMETQLAEIQSFKDNEVVTICPGGGFSLVAAEVLAEAGFKNVSSLSGGADGWFKNGYPTEKGTKHEN
jgi:rhodanese-related sulfurtransferase